MPARSGRPKRVSILVSGDLCPLNETGSLLADGQSQAVFGSVLQEIRNSDISVLNLESPLTARTRPILKCGPNLRSSPRVAAGLRKAGFSIACLANNHIRDFGPAGVRDTVTALEKQGFRWFGIRRNDRQIAPPLHVTRRGLKVAFLGFAENEFGGADAVGWGADGLKPAENFEAVSRAAERADIVLVFVHGGSEYCPVPSPRMVRLYRSFIRAGASAVIGSHPHVPQGYERYRGRIIFYSLGNFLFPGTSSKPFWNRGVAVRLSFTGRTLSDVALVPVKANIATGTVDLMRSSERDRFLRYLERLSSVLSSDGRLDRLWAGWCFLKGETWLRRFVSAQWPPRTNEALAQLRAIENLVRCEAHNDVGVTFLRLLRTGQLEAAKRQAPALERLMNDRQEGAEHRHETHG